MRGVEAAFQGLQPITFFDHFAGEALIFGDLGPGIIGQRRLFFSRPHIGPDDAALFDRRIGGDADFRAKFPWLVHLFGAIPVDVELPAMIDAAQAVFFIAAKPQRGQAVGAIFFDHANAAIGRPERDQVFAKQAHADGRTVVFRQFPGQQRRHPIAAQGLAHRRAGADPGDAFIVFAAQHGIFLTNDVLHLI